MAEARRYPLRSTRGQQPDWYGNPVSHGGEIDTTLQDTARTINSDRANAHIDAITRNRDKAVDIMDRRGSRRVLAKCSQRIEREYDSLAAIRGVVEAEMDPVRLSQFQALVALLSQGVDEIVDEIERHLEERENELVTVTEFDSLATVVDLPRRLREVQEEADRVPPNTPRTNAEATREMEQTSRRAEPPSLPTNRTNPPDDRSQASQGVRPMEQVNANAITARMQPPVPSSSNPEDIASLLAGALERLACRTELPPAPGVVFDGSSAEYPKFIQDFRSRVDDRPLPDGSKFAQLVASTTGRAKLVVELYRGTEAGYSRALVALRERFGQPGQIVSARLRIIRDMKRIADYETHRLLDFADKLEADWDAFSDLGYAAEANCQSTLQTVHEKLPPRVQGRWVSVLLAKEARGERAGFKDMVDVVRQQAKRSNHGVFPIESAPRSDFKPTKHENINLMQDGKNPPDPGKQPDDEDRRRDRGWNNGIRGNGNARNGSSTDSGGSGQIGNGGPTNSCEYCSGNHVVTDCTTFAARTPEERRLFVIDKRLCYCCLGKHPVRLCRRRDVCPVHGCNGYHHRLIHTARPPAHQPGKPASDQQRHGATPRESTNNVTEGAAKEATMPMPPTTTEIVQSTQTSGPPRVLLRVVPVSVSADGDNWTSTYALIDSGSTCTMLSRELAARAGLQVSETRAISISTVLTTNTRQVPITACTLAPLTDGTVRFDVREAHVTEDLGIDPRFAQAERHAGEFQHLQGLCEDVKVDLPKVCVLIGENVPMAHHVAETRHGHDPNNEPYAVKTPFGWCIAGPTERATALATSTDHRLADAVDKWWSEERHGFKNDDGPTLSVEDKIAAEILERTTTIDGGHYSVGMLWRNACPSLHNNLAQAFKRLQQLRRKFIADTNFASMYTEAMQKLVQQGYMRRITHEEEIRTSGITWYLPHHGVRNPNKPGKVRPVNDAAATYLGTSLNKALLHGPDMNNSLVGVLLRFRNDNVAVVADVADMFMQVKVPHHDQDALRVLWWGEGIDRPHCTYKMTRHVFGAADSPCVCSYALRRCAQDNAADFSDVAVRTVLESFYVDDLLCSAPDAERAVALAREVKKLLGCAGFKLTKFLSNSAAVVEQLPEADRVTTSLDIVAKDEPQRALGVTWLLKPDVLSVKIPKPESPGTPPTRRSCLSTVCSIYDPLGLCSPGTLPAKKILQNACKKGLPWDEPLPEELAKRWCAWERDVPLLGEVKIPRSYVGDAGSWDNVQAADLHHFSDASEVGYGTVSYLRLERKTGEVDVQFLMGKSRCTPKEFVSVPRLELQAATVAARIDRLIARELRLPVPIKQTVFWTDSTIVLGYICNKEKRFKTYVANRLEEIHDSSEPSQWKHCPTTQNPADLASRGVRPTRLIEHREWIEGPAFLRLAKSEWPAEVRKEVDAKDPEIKMESSVFAAVEPSPMEQFLLRHSTLNGLLRHCAYLQRFIRYLRDTANKKADTVQTTLGVSDLRRARDAMVRLVQRQSFPEGERTRSLAPLNPFRNTDDGLLRVGGRLAAAIHLPYDARHPVILPKRHHLTTLVIRHYHVTSAHCGQEQTLTDMRRLYYPIHGKSAVRKLLRSCVTCRKIKGNLMTQIMADLPRSRTEVHEPPFTICGMDAFGPITVKRGRRTATRHGLLIVCFSTRCIHLEMLEDLSKDSALNATRRFIGRRGTPREIHADNGGNLVGMSREMRHAIKKWNELAPEMAQRGIEWKFTTPYASHMAGVWERLVKTVKQALHAVLGGKNVVGDDMLTTIFAEVEGFVNARPLLPASDDLQDLEPLTPMHFLVGRNQVALPPGDFSAEDRFARRWKATQAHISNVWTRWIGVYLPSLQRRTKWIFRKRDAEVGDLVLISEGMLKRGHWPLGRVVAVYPSEDGRVRSVDVRTASSVVKRPVHKLCLLEAAGSSDTDG